MEKKDTLRIGEKVEKVIAAAQVILSAYDLLYSLDSMREVLGLHKDDRVASCILLLKEQSLPDLPATPSPIPALPANSTFRDLKTWVRAAVEFNLLVSLLQDSRTTFTPPKYLKFHEGLKKVKYSPAMSRLRELCDRNDLALKMVYQKGY